MKLVYQVEDKPTIGKLVVFAIQQLLAIMAATLVVPVIINGNINSNAGVLLGWGGDKLAMSPAAALFGAGVGTIVYLLFTKFKSPVFLGSSFAFLGSMTAAFAGAVSMAAGYLGIIIGAAIAGLVYVAISFAVRFAGVEWLNKLMPPVVIGPTVTIIGLSLAGNAVGDAQKGGLSGAHPLVCLVIALATLATVVICSTYGKKMFKLIPFICGIIVGYVLAVILTVIGNLADVEALQVVSFKSFTDLWADGVKVTTFVAFPDFTFLEGFSKKGFEGITGGYIGTLVAAYLPVAFVVFAEHVADHKNISSIIGRDLLKDPGLENTLLGDGVGSIAGAFFGGCPNTTYGESVACVAITGNASVLTIFAAAIGAILISFLSPFVAFVNSIPACVMGGVCIALYGFIAVSGLKMVQKVDLGQDKNLFVVSTILICGIGGLALNFGKVTVTSIATALILGILVNLLCKRAKDSDGEQTDADDKSKED